ncbi:MAG: hypothetical protein ACYSOF_01570 [Planctomycetota bacterium]|jgi:hypothetical protein
MNKWQRALVQIALVAVIVAVAIGAAKMMSSFRKAPEKKEQTVLWNREAADGGAGSPAGVGQGCPVPSAAC